MAAHQKASCPGSPPTLLLATQSLPMHLLPTTIHAPRPVIAAATPNFFPGEVQFNVDFTGTALALLADTAALEAAVTTGDNARVLLANVYRHPINEGWRMSLKVQRLDPSQPVEWRAFLQHGSDVLTETWTCALPAQ